MIAGYNVRGAVDAARQQRGSNLDMANLLCAVYRAAGIPARVVIGYDHEAQRKEDRPPVTAWVEFFLMVDQENQRGEWIPVDIIRQREFSSRAPDVTRPWKYFGNSDLSNNYSVISFHWHPPTTVVNSGPPAFWGWLPKPTAPNVDQGVRFHAFETPTTADRQRRQREGR
jgi:transglutaminase-like putative cysteine protease